MREAVGPLKALASKLKPRNDDDMIDRLHYIVSPSILFAFAFIIGAKQFVGQPIQCWAPSEFKRQWMQYAEGLCFVENTYFVSMDEKFPMHEEERQRRQIHYYQWVPFLLMGQALLLMLPKLIWNAFSWKSGLDVRSLIARAQALSARGEFEGKKKAGEELGARIGLSIEQRQRKQMSGIDGKLPDYPAAALDFGPCASANFLTSCYLLLKLLNLASVLFQLQVLTKFLGSADDDHQYWGVRVMQDLLAGRDWSQSGAFPRVTYCDVPIRKPSRAADYQNFSLQCVLMINMVNEKIFLFLWFWLMGLALVGMLNLLLWLFRAFNWDSSYQFVQSQLRLSNTTNVPRGKELHNFVRRGLSRDGVTVLRLIAANCDPLLASLLVKQLWHRFQEAKNQGQLKQAVESREKMAAAQPQESRHI